MVQLVRYIGGPLHNTDTTAPDDVADQAGLWTNHVASGTRYAYAKTLSVLSGPRTIMLAVDSVAETVLRAYPTPEEGNWYDVTQGQLEPMASEVGQTAPTRGWTTKWKENDPCVQPNLFANTALDTTITFSLTFPLAIPNWNALFFLGIKPSLSTGCLFVDAFYSQHVLSTPDGVARVTIPYVPNAIFWTQWVTYAAFNLSWRWSNVSIAKTW